MGTNVFNVGTLISLPADGNTHAVTTGGWTGGTVPLTRVLTFSGPADITLSVGAAKGGSLSGNEWIEGTRLVATFHPS